MMGVEVMDGFAELKPQDSIKYLVFFMWLGIWYVNCQYFSLTWKKHFSLFFLDQECLNKIKQCCASFVKYLFYLVICRFWHIGAAVPLIHRSKQGFLNENIDS